MFTGTLPIYHTTKMQIPEDRLDPILQSVLRSLPFALRGSSTPELPFNAFGQIALPPWFPVTLATVIAPLCEPCVLYKWIQQHLQRVKPLGLLQQALYSAIRDKLRLYLALICDLETRSIASLASAQIILQSPTQYLRLFCIVLQQVSSSSDGESANVLNILGEYMQHGDPLIRKYADQLFKEVRDPFQKLIDHWEHFGSLDLDIYHEFYVTKADASSEFELASAKVPHFLSHADAKRSLDKGSAVYFIRSVCGDHEYDGTNKTFEEISQRAHYLLMQQNKLLTHFQGLRDYMLLANGNFVDALFRNDSDNFLMQPVNKVGSYLASEFFLAAINDISQGKHEDTDVLQAVDAYILGMETESKEPTGTNTTTRVWEAFVGKYHLDAKPLKLIVDKKSVTKYERCFSSLWRIRLAVYSLNESAAKLRELSRANREMTSFNELHMIMNTKILGLQDYIYYRIIDEQWGVLNKVIARSSRQLTLTQIKQAHAGFLDAVVDAVARPARALSIQALTKLVLGLQSMLEQDEPTDDKVEQIATAFEEYMNSLAYDI